VTSAGWDSNDKTQAFVESLKVPAPAWKHALEGPLAEDHGARLGRERRPGDAFNFSLRLREVEVYCFILRLYDTPR
jgi:hypothetical protein